MAKLEQGLQKSEARELVTHDQVVTKFLEFQNQLS